MKICVFSDSHGSSLYMKEIIRREKPDRMFFLGDGEQDLPAIRKEFPALPIQAVRGNCDVFSELPAELVCTVENVRFFLTHGHRCGVKSDWRLETLKAAARAKDAQVALFGHTHEPQLEWDVGLLLLNPGTARGCSPSYAVVEITDGKILPRICSF